MDCDLKIAVVGCGALGGYYGAHFCRAGYETHFLLRSDYEIVRRQGLQIRSPCGDFFVKPHCACTPEQIGPADLVLIGLKTTANHLFQPLLRPLVNENTLLLSLQNGLGNEDRLACLFSPDQVLGGLCFVCLNRVEPGIVCHLAHGNVVVGEYRSCPRPRTHELAARFEQTGIHCSVTNDLARAHWEKLVWNIPFNGLGVASSAGYEAVWNGQVDLSRPLGPCLSTDLLLGHVRWEALVRELMHEVISVAQALGYSLKRQLANQMIEKTRSMGAYKASTLIDFERNQPLEMQSLFLQPRRLAHQAGVDVPRLSALCQVLETIDPGRAVHDRPLSESV